MFNSWRNKICFCLSKAIVHKLDLTDLGLISHISQLQIFATKFYLNLHSHRNKTKSQKIHTSAFHVSSKL